MTMNPTLGVNDIGHTGSGAADRVSVAHAGQSVEQRLNLVFGINHELNVVTSRESEEAITMLIGDVTYFTNILDRNQTAGTATNGVYLVTSLRLVHKNAGLNNFMPQPFALVGLNYRWKKLFVMWGTKI
jgi:hypothetical protein